jgi:hypothetical protein
MRRVAVLVLVLAGAVPARAQDRLFVGAREVGAIGHFGMDLGTAPVLLHFPRFGGDRFVHDRAGHAIVDLRTGARLQVPNGVPVAYDRARPRLFTAENDGIWSHDVVTGWSALLLAVPVQQFVGCLHATSADVLFCAFTRVDGQVDILRPSLAGPMWVTTTRFADLSFPSWVATPDGSRVYFEHCSRLSDQFPNFCVQRWTPRPAGSPLAAARSPSHLTGAWSGTRCASGSSPLAARVSTSIPVIST